MPMSRAVMVGTMALVMAAMLLAMAMPAFAVKGGEKPFTYGDCVSAVAAEGGYVQAVTKTMAPLQSKGKGTDGKFLKGCRY
jgi:hypothetical protein